MPKRHARAARIGVIAASAVAAATLAAPADAAPAFHTTFTVSGVGGSGISGFVVDTHERGVPNFENETWQLRGLTPGATYVPVITLGLGCAGAGLDIALPLAVPGVPATANASGSAKSVFKVPYWGLGAYLGELGITTPPPEVGAQLALVDLDELPPAVDDFGFVSTTELNPVAATDCQLVATT